MKKISLFFVTIMLCVATAFCSLFTACGKTTDDNGEKVSYTVTVLGEDEITGVSGVTVIWSQSGTESASAVTGSDGKAAVELVAASYDVTLSSLPEGMTYSPASVTSTARGITLVLEKSKVNYSVTVNQHDGSAAAGVTVTWTSDNAIAGTATTGANGKAEKELVYGNYSVTVSNLPFGNIYVGSKQVTGAQPETTFTLESGETTEYTVTVKSEGGLKFKDYTVIAYLGTDPVASAVTDDDGVVTFELPEDYTYNVRVQNVPEGYSFVNVTLSGSQKFVDLILRSQVIAGELPSNTYYLVGDIIHDYELITAYKVDGEYKTYTISEILESKKMIVLNFWGINCSACMLEMPAMQEAYELYSDDVEFLAVSNYMGGDSNSVIESFRNENGYTFPMFRDTHSFDTKFALTAWPTNVVIDRYGAIARIEDGALTSLSFWEKLIEQYTADDYVQTFVPGTDRSDSVIVEMAKPDVTVEEGHYEKVGETINNVAEIPEGCSISWFGEPEATSEYTWPFLLGPISEDSDEIVLYPSNTGHDNTFSFIYADVTMTQGKVLTFDYWSQTETDCDHFYVLFDGKLIYTISGENSGWQTCYVFADITGGEHQLALSYIKDESRELGFDNVYIKNVRFTDASDIDQSLDMLRGAAYGTPESGATSYPYYASVELGDDGYYYVNLSELVGAEYAGNDSSPMLFVNFTTATNWNSLSLNTIITSTDDITGEYVYDCTFEYEGEVADWRGLLIEYATLSGNSDVKGYLPVDESMRELLEAFLSHISGNSSHSNEWLEVCYFYSHYGSGDFIGNPIIGLTEKTAIEVGIGTYTADLTRIIAPFPVAIFSFTPDASSVYRIESLIPESQANLYGAQIWVYTETVDDFMYYSGDDRIFRDGENEHNFVANLYLTANTKYYIALAFLSNNYGTMNFKVSVVGDSIEVVEPCTSGDYIAVGNHLEPRYSVAYDKDDDGYYHVLNDDGSLGAYIYLDFKYATFGNQYPLSIVINQYIVDPLDYTEKICKVFDFTTVIEYITIYDDDGGIMYDYTIANPALFDSENADKYIDYTAIMQAYCDEAMETDGLIRVNDELVKILTMYHYLRTDWTLDGYLAEASQNEWLRFCWYFRTIDENNPA